MSEVADEIAVITGIFAAGGGFGQEENAECRLPNAEWGFRVGRELRRGGIGQNRTLSDSFELFIINH